MDVKVDLDSDPLQAEADSDSLQAEADSDPLQAGADSYPLHAGATSDHLHEDTLEKKAQIEKECRLRTNLSEFFIVWPLDFDKLFVDGCRLKQPF